MFIAFIENSRQSAVAGGGRRYFLKKRNYTSNGKQSAVGRWLQGIPFLKTKLYFVRQTVGSRQVVAGEHCITIEYTIESTTEFTIEFTN